MTRTPIEREVAKVAARYRLLWRAHALSAAWLGSALLCAAALAARWIWGIGPAGVAPVLLPILGVAVVAALAAAAIARRWSGDTHWVARRIEAANPRLDSRLLAALEQRPDLPDGRFGFLQETVLREVLSHARRHPWARTVPEGDLRLARFASAACLCAFGAVAAGLVLAGERAGPRVGGVGSGGAAGTGSPRLEVVVDPGDAEIERGSSLLILARFEENVVSEATLCVETDAGDGAGARRRMAMAKSLDDPVFAVRLPRVDEGFSYRVEFAEGTSPTYRVTVFDLPALERADARLVYPEPTGLAPATILDTRRIALVEGTELTWILRLNKEVERAWLVAEDGSEIDLEEAASDASDSSDASGEGAPAVRATTLILRSSTRHTVRLLDGEGRENRDPPVLAARVLPNRRADLKVVAPARDVRASPLEELTLTVKVWDDFGLERYGLGYSVAGDAPRDVVLGEEAPGKEAREASHILDLEALAAEPDQLVSYYFWADDLGPDGRPRRTFSDMYFAEVRPFEEIFRQGQDLPGGSEADRERRPRDEGSEGEGRGDGEGEGARDAGALAELQKQIIGGTWKLIRLAGERAASGDASAARGGGAGLAEDGGLLRDSQRSALQRAEGLGDTLEDEESRRHAAAAAQHMGVALEGLTEAVEAESSDPLGLSLAAEQAAYDALLKLRAREHEVVRARDQGGRGQPGERGRQGESSRSPERSREQLQQLELSSTRNRYEMQRTASGASERDPAEREDRQILNRLRELAQRQGDVNERLKELQSALAEARDEAEREEALARLKRLREEERQILRDADELADRMEEPANQRRMAEARDRLGATRENVRRASEALEQGQVSTAAAAGTRAERELRELSEEIRQRTAGRFVEEMREMRSEAEELERREEELGRGLAGLDASAERSLRGTTERERIRDGLEEQRRDLGGLLDWMEETVEEAETPEPLLAEKLYDTLRRSRQDRTDESLDATRRLLEGGFIEDAGRLERRVRDGLRELRDGVAEAAESVLGDETGALRRARREVERLAEEVEREIARAEGGRDPAGGAGGAEGGEGGEDAERAAGQGRAAGTEAAAGAERDAGAERPGGAGRRGRPSTLRGDADPDGRGGLPPYLAGGDDGGRELAPFGGDDFRDWADRLRDVEEMLDDPDLRGDAARIRDRARGLRTDVKRHSREPGWDLLRVSVAEPLKDLGRRIGEELLRREPRDSLVPIDSDPVPPEYAERVRRYYERLGSGK